MPEWYRESFDGLYSDIYPHRDDGEAALAIELLGRFVRLPGAAVLDVACGRGRHLRALSRAGARAYGVDLSRVLLSVHAKSSGLDPTLCVRGDMRHLPFRGRSFDVCISMFTSLGYFGDIREDLTVLKEMYKVLKPGGHCLVDHGNLAWLKHHLVPRTVRREPPVTTVETRAFLGDGRTVEKFVAVYQPEVPSNRLSSARCTALYRERVTFFTRGELAGLLAQAGFEVLRVFGDYEGGAFKEGSSSRLMLLARRPK